MSEMMEVAMMTRCSLFFSLSTSGGVYAGGGFFTRLPFPLPPLPPFHWCGADSIRPLPVPRPPPCLGPGARRGGT